VIDTFGYTKDTIVVEEVEDEEEAKSSSGRSIAELEVPEAKVKSRERPSKDQQNKIKVRIQQKQQWLPLLSPMLPGLSFSTGCWREYLLKHSNRA
jgi:rRNA maturation endonuclease Nob1